MLGDPKVEAVIVVIADQFHVDSAIRALKGRQARARGKATWHNNQRLRTTGGRSP